MEVLWEHGSSSDTEGCAGLSSLSLGLLII
jgi:hypothetical protein